MRQASWEEMWRGNEAPQPKEKRSWTSGIGVFSWEELVTLVIVMIAFVTVVQSIDNADWVAEMPSLYTIAFLGLAAGLGLSRLKVPEVFLHLTSLAIGAAGVLLTATSTLNGSLPDRTRELVDRFELWASALTSGGISNDNLPFVVLVVSATYLMAYVSAWSLFRWYNAWIALVPPGLALLTNISYLPGQTSFPLLVYLFCAILLVARIHVLRRAREWRRTGTAYPDLISLHVLNVTVWVAILLLALAWFLPIGSGSGALFTLWQKVTAPVVEPLADLGRVFSSIDSKKGGTVHRFGSTLPLQGEISLGGGEVMQVTATETGFLRAQSYDFYTAQGWKIGGTAQITTTPWPASKALQSVDEARRQFRRNVSISVTTSKEAGVIVSAGQPLAVNLDSRVVFGQDPSDVTSIRPQSRLNDDTQYRVDSTVSNATVQRLRSAGSAYPSWTAPYLQLPQDFSRRVSAKARELTLSDVNSYDKAVSIEQFLRTLAIDTKIDPAPPKRDSVEYFLFTLNRGYFDYHASAMVVMLRSLGIPARLAVGYVIRPQDRIPDTSTYVVAEANAFAWPEVYFPGLGWVEFNPTPSEPRITRSGNDDQEFFDGFFEEEPIEDLGLPMDDLAPADTTTETLDNLQVEEGSNLVSRVLISAILAVLGFTAVVGGVFRYSWQRGMGGLAYPVQVWEKTLRLARWARIRPAPQDTPRDIVARLRRELPEVQDMDYLGETFLRSRYGQKDLTPEEKARLQGAWSSVRKTLVQRLLRWK